MAGKAGKGRRGATPLSLAFLDVMFCGFGAVILIFLILDHTSTVSVVESSPNQQIELNMLEREIAEGVQGSLELRNLLADLSEEFERGEVEAEELREQVELLRREIELLNNSGADSDQLRDRLLSDIESLETQIEELLAQEFERSGNNVRQFLGDGNRQYLSGMFLGGQRILILMDSSASMLDETLVNIIRTRNMSDERKVQSPKWLRVLRAVDWITTQVPVTSRYQIWSFNTEVRSALPGDLLIWREVADRDELEIAVGQSARDRARGRHQSRTGFPARRGNGAAAGQHLPDYRWPADGQSAGSRERPRDAQGSDRNVRGRDRRTSAQCSGQYHIDAARRRSERGGRVLATGDGDQRVLSSRRRRIGPETRRNGKKMRRRSRETEQFSISFLDVASCGFGAIIILLMITKSAAPTTEELTETIPAGVIQELTQQLFAIRSETDELRQELNSARDRNASMQQLIASLRSQRQALEGDYALAREQGDEATEEIGQLLLARQTLTEEMQRLFNNAQVRESSYIGGVPVDSEYIIFVIDTSGSMYQNAWGRMLEVIEETLDVYPEVKGIQVMNDMGDYMFHSFRGQWIPDTPSRRLQIISTLRTWDPYSNSSPVEGVAAAIDSFYSPDRKISIYVLGDDFQQGGSIEQVLRLIDRINVENANGDRLVRIHGIGFPVILSGSARFQQSGYRYASLMRELTQRNGGTFVGLNDFR